MNNLAQMLQAIKANPMQILGNRFRLPATAKDPAAILQYLMQTGQVSQAQINSAYQMAQTFHL